MGARKIVPKTIGEDPHHQQGVEQAPEEAKHRPLVPDTEFARRREIDKELARAEQLGEGRGERSQRGVRYGGTILLSCRPESACTG